VHLHPGADVFRQFLVITSVGFWQDQEELAGSWREESRFAPQAESLWRDELLERWAAAVRRA